MFFAAVVHVLGSSFPRTRESIYPVAKTPNEPWIPAFAGMTLSELAIR